MGLFRRIRRRFLPPSQDNLLKSIASLNKELKTLAKQIERVADGQERLAESQAALLARIEQADSGTNGNLDFKFELMCRIHDDQQRYYLELTNKLAAQLKTHDAQAKMLLWEGLREPEENIDDVRMRFYRDMPPAQGNMRILQRASLTLLKEFSEFCKQNDLQYFLLSGTLLGAIRHCGFIPWDDDIDVGMMKDDLNRLIELTKDSDVFRVTVVYDQYVSCKQIRFRSVNPDIPCFVDVFEWTYCKDNDDAVRNAYKTIRQGIKEEIDELVNEGIVERGCLSEGSSEASDLEAIYRNARTSALSLGYEVDQDEARYIAWSVINLDPLSPVADMYFPLDSVFPLTEVSFEGESFLAPKRSERVLELIYGDWLELPDDMIYRFKHLEVGKLDTELLEGYIAHEL